ncbi:tetraacyldisaccharide 4'-kinase [Maribacter sp. X9]|uniref:tetraacyldisaccharide 4'-kinase n=1 Tax=Maribacter sp. X9 TaxID=3402159 RepID=UPI003AF3EC48
MQVLRKLLFPISLVYAMVVYLRNLFYDLGIFPSKSSTTPTICVGNLSVGGTGKTPMIELLVRLLKEDYKIAVLSRGYKRKSEGFVLAHSSTTVQELGDEPYQLKSKFPTIEVAVEANRRNGIVQLDYAVQPELILLDDAYQHRKVNPGFSILLTAYDQIYSDDWYLPTGNLRDSKAAAKRAQIIVVTKCPEDLDASSRIEMIKRLHPDENQKVLFSFLSYEPRLKGEGIPLDISSLKDRKVTLVTGIANPAPLVDYLKMKELKFEHLKFSDHHFFTKKELETLKQKEFVLTTEKDYVRLKNDLVGLYYIEISHRFLENGLELLSSELQDFMSRNS